MCKRRADGRTDGGSSSRSRMLVGQRWRPVATTTSKGCRTVNQTTLRCPSSSSSTSPAAFWTHSLLTTPSRMKTMAGKGGPCQATGCCPLISTFVCRKMNYCFSSHFFGFQPINFQINISLKAVSAEIGVSA